MEKNRPWGVHTIRDILGGRNSSTLDPVFGYVQAVPEPYTGNRLVAAWWVLAGRAFAIIWPTAGEVAAARGVRAPKEVEQPRAGESRDALRRNARVSARYDELMLEGRHGHYETMFRVVSEEIRLATSGNDF